MSGTVRPVKDPGCSAGLPLPPPAVATDDEPELLPARTHDLDRDRRARERAEILGDGVRDQDQPDARARLSEQRLEAREVVRVEAQGVRRFVGGEEAFDA